jgi:hypothetical protein
MLQVFNNFSRFMSCHWKETLFVTFATLQCAQGIAEVVVNYVNPVKWPGNGRKLC